MPAGALSANSGRTRQAPAWLEAKASTYFLLSRKDRCSGPATSSGATSATERCGSAAFFSSAPARAARSAKANGPALVKKRGSANSVLLLGLRLSLGRLRLLGRLHLDLRRREIDGRQGLVHQRDDFLGQVHLVVEQYDLAARQNDIGAMRLGYLAGRLVHSLLHLGHRGVVRLLEGSAARRLLALIIGDAGIEGARLLRQSILRQRVAFGLLLDRLLLRAQRGFFGRALLLEFLAVFVRLDPHGLDGQRLELHLVDVDDGDHRRRQRSAVLRQRQSRRGQQQQ